jgi:hypothetical protein
VDPNYAIHGCNVGVLSDTQMVIEPFSLWMWNRATPATPIGDVINFSATKYPDITVVGLNGRDFGSAGTCPDGAYALYAVYNPTTNDMGFIFSNHISYGTLIRPAGYDYVRKLMYGVVVKAGKLYPNHCAHWPMPKVIFTNQTLVASFFSAATWSPVNLASLIPEASRMGHFRCVVTNANSNVWLSPSGSLTYSKLIMYNEMGIRTGIDCRVDGNETIFVQFQPGSGGRLDLYLEGFSMTEVS